MKLYASAASSFARKVRILLLEKHVEHEVVMLNLWEPNDYQNVNPIGKVPSLELDDGRVLINSALIADYVDATWPTPRFIPVDAQGRFEVRRWEAYADGAMEAVGAMLYEMRFHDEAKRSQAWIDRQRGKFEAGLQALERMLDNRAWCVGNAMSLADVAIACHLGFINLRVPQHFPKEKYPGLHKLWTTMEARESFRESAPPSA